MPSFSLLLATCFPFITRPASPEAAARGIAPGTTAKAVIELALRIHRERGGFLVVERAAGAVVFASLLKFYAAIDNLNDIEAIQ